MVPRLGSLFLYKVVFGFDWELDLIVRPHAAPKHEKNGWRWAVWESPGPEAPKRSSLSWRSILRGAPS